MSDGFHRVRFNSQERAISPDHNRLQTLLHRDVAEMFRAMLSVRGSDDDDLTPIVPSAIETPLRAEILSGFLVRPQDGSFTVLIDPGVLFALAPDNASEESNYKFIRDAGRPITNPLAISANSSGSTRIDVIECRVDPVERTVTDSRDIFNETTGLFSAQQVVKEAWLGLEFRIREGTPGLGMPAHASGWLPLCVASVPDGATSNSDVTFWDVRPLVADREFTPFAVASDLPIPGVQMNAFASVTDDLHGYARATYAGRRIGGKLRRGTPGTDDPIDTQDATLGEGAWAWEVGPQLMYTYLLLPFGLPRWARYSDAPGRHPRAPRGILVWSRTPPTHLFGKPSLPIVLPDACGFAGQTTTDGVCIACNVEAEFGNLGFTSTGNTQMLGGLIWRSLSLNVNGSNLESALLEEGTHYPANARAIYVSAVFGVSLATITKANYAGKISLFSGTVDSSDYVAVEGGGGVIANPTAGTSVVTVTTPMVRVPIPTRVDNAPSSPRLIRVAPELSGGTLQSGALLKIMGWDIGP